MASNLLGEASGFRHRQDRSIHRAAVQAVELAVEHRSHTAKRLQPCLTQVAVIADGSVVAFAVRITNSRERAKCRDDGRTVARAKRDMVASLPPDSVRPARGDESAFQS